MYFAERSEMMFSTRVVWLISSRRSSDASRFIVSTLWDTARSLATSVDVLRTDPPTDSRLGITGIGRTVVNPADALELVVLEWLRNVSLTCAPLLPIAIPSASPS